MVRVNLTIRKEGKMKYHIISSVWWKYKECSEMVQNIVEYCDQHSIEPIPLKFYLNDSGCWCIQNLYSKDTNIFKNVTENLFDQLYNW